MSTSTEVNPEAGPSLDSDESLGHSGRLVEMQNIRLGQNIRVQGSGVRFKVSECSDQGSDFRVKG